MSRISGCDILKYFCGRSKKLTEVGIKSERFCGTSLKSDGSGHEDQVVRNADVSVGLNMEGFLGFHYSG